MQPRLFAVKVEPDDNDGFPSPMETSTPITSTRFVLPPLAADALPSLSPKGGGVPDVKSASQLPRALKVESRQDSLSGGGGGGGGGVASSADTLNNNSGLISQDRSASNASGGHLSNGASPPSPVSNQASAAVSLDGGSGSSSSAAAAAAAGHPAGGASKNSGALSFTPSLQKRAPDTWSAQDVCLFLSVNDCGACSEAVLRRVSFLCVCLQSVCSHSVERWGRGVLLSFDAPNVDTYKALSAMTSHFAVYTTTQVSQLCLSSYRASNRGGCYVSE